MIPARKSWGQHFLASAETALRIVSAAEIGANETAVEVGPGQGALTRLLAERARRLLAIEIDPRRASDLETKFAPDPNVRIVRGDALDRPFGAWLALAGWEGPAVLVSNLPYNAATPILQAAIEEPEAVSRAVVTVQREVAGRLVADPVDRDYGYLSVRSKAFAQARILFHLPPGAFRPRPRVTSSVVLLTPRSPALEAPMRDRALALASLGFRSRRKTLANALSSEGGRSRWERALETLGSSPRARAEELSLDDYLRLAELVPS